MQGRGGTLYSYAFHGGRMHSGMLVVEYMLADEGPGDGGVAVVQGSHSASTDPEPLFFSRQLLTDLLRLSIAGLTPSVAVLFACRDELPGASQPAQRQRLDAARDGGQCQGRRRRHLQRGAQLFHFGGLPRRALKIVL